MLFDHICRKLGISHASHQLPRDDLEGLIVGERDERIQDPLRAVRRGIQTYLDNQTVMLSALDCSMKCVTACPPDRVIACLSRNHDHVLDEGENPFL